MIKCSGKSVLKGIAIGRIYLYKKQEYVLKQETVENPEAEVERLEKAKKPPEASWRSCIRKHWWKPEKSRR